MSSLPNGSNIQSLKKTNSLSPNNEKDSFEAQRPHATGNNMKLQMPTTKTIDLLVSPVGPHDSKLMVPVSPQSAVPNEMKNYNSEQQSPISPSALQSPLDSANSLNSSASSNILASLTIQRPKPVRNTESTKNVAREFAKIPDESKPSLLASVADDKTTKQQPSVFGRNSSGVGITPPGIATAFKLPGIGGNAIPQLKSVNAEKSPVVVETVFPGQKTRTDNGLKPVVAAVATGAAAKVEVAKVEISSTSISHTAVPKQSSNTTTSNVPEFLAMRNKMLSKNSGLGSGNSTGSKTDLTGGSNAALEALGRLKPAGSRDNIDKSKAPNPSSTTNATNSSASGTAEWMNLRTRLKPTGSNISTSNNLGTSTTSTIGSKTANELPKSVDHTDKTVIEKKSIEQKSSDTKTFEPKSSTSQLKTDYLSVKTVNPSVSSSVATPTSGSAVPTPKASVLNRFQEIKSEPTKAPTSVASAPQTTTTSPTTITDNPRPSSSISARTSSPTQYKTSATTTASTIKPSQASQYVQPKVDNIAKTGDGFNVALKKTKNDRFVSATGGVTRPKEPMLLIFKGKKKLLATRIKTSVLSLNHTDVFVFDYGASNAGISLDDQEKVPIRTLYVVSGEKSSRIRRTKVLELANLIKDIDYSGKAEIALVELATLKDRVLSEKELVFWHCLLGKTCTKNDVLEALKSIPVSDNIDDAEFEKQVNSKISVYVFDKDHEDPEIIANDGSDLKVALLTPQRVLVIDCTSEMYVWSGKDANEDDRNRAVEFADIRAQQIQPPPPVFLEGQRFERTIFKSKFEDWPAGGKELSVYNVLEVKAVGNVKAKDKEWRVYDRGADTKKVDKLDIARMYDKNALAENSIVKNTESVEIDPTELIHRDWGFVRLRIWAVASVSSNTSTSTPKVVQLTPQLLKEMSREYSADSPFVFHSEECYIFVYEYKERPASMADTVLAERMKLTKEELINSMRDAAVLYTWAGVNSRVQDQAFMAHVALELDKWQREGKLDCKAKPRHVRVTEGKEPVHFMNVLRGGNIPREQSQKVLDMLPHAVITPSPVFTVRFGMKSAGVTLPQEPQLYHVVGPHEDVVRVGQIPNIDASLLTSLHSFVLSDGKSNVFVWNGIGGYHSEKQAAEKFARGYFRATNVVVMNEGQEPANFWQLLGSRKEYDKQDVYKIRPSLPAVLPPAVIPLASSQAQNVVAPYDTRLWRISYFLNGNPTATEILPFIAQDLEEDSVYILDAYFACFVWIGSEVARNRSNSPIKEVQTGESAASGKSTTSGFRELALGVDTAMRYCDYVQEREQHNQQSRLDRRKNCFVLQSGREPSSFKSQFISWNERQPQKVSGELAWPSNIPVEEAWHLINDKKYPLADLKRYQSERINLPFGLDPEHIDNYMTEEDFVKVYGAERDKYQAMPKWKQMEVKRKSGFF